MDVPQTSQPLDGLLKPAEAKALKRAFGYTTVGELLEHYPRKLLSRGELTMLSALTLDEHVTIVAKVVEVTERPTRKRDKRGRTGSLLTAKITDGSGIMTLTFFNQPWRAQEIHANERGLFAGKVTSYQGKLQLTHPDYVMFDDLDAEWRAVEEAKHPIPVYAATSAMASWRIARAISEVLDQLSDDQLNGEDPLDATAREAFGVGTRAEALRRIHRPESKPQWYAAKASLKAREAYVLQAALLQVRREKAQDAAIGRRAKPDGLLARFDASLPFALTPDQQTVSQTIMDEIASDHPMYRLVQGEVGSGKTVVALRAMLAVAESGGQSALLAPTEVLARQHFETVIRLLGPDLSARLHPVLITGSMNTAERKRAALASAAGQAQIVIGTHALLSDATMFYDLGLVVVDEQHRFGVAQREQLRSKAATTPHMLLLTATPIPRTVAMTVFGDLDVSSIMTLPAGRQPIETFVVALDEKPEWIRRVWQRVAEDVMVGLQAYVVCSIIDEQEAPTQHQQTQHLQSVEEVARHLGQVDSLQDVRIGTLHGKMDAAAKDAVMRDFANGDIDVLVTTTVVEVGVNVPNATVMVVLDADRFGIAQLHQLRGRIGRGEHASVALLVTEAPAGSLARERLDTVASSTDGFVLAEADLKYRHEGDVLGAEQSGATSSLKLLRVIDDQDLILKAKHVAEATFAADPDLRRHATLLRTIERALSVEQEDYIVSA